MRLTMTTSSPRWAATHKFPRNRRQSYDFCLIGGQKTVWYFGNYSFGGHAKTVHQLRRQTWLCHKAHRFHHPRRRLVLLSNQVRGWERRRHHHSRRQWHQLRQRRHLRQRQRALYRLNSQRSRLTWQMVFFAPWRMSSHFEGVMLPRSCGTSTAGDLAS